jgi:hypothetical protein
MTIQGHQSGNNFGCAGRRQRRFGLALVKDFACDGIHEVSRARSDLIIREERFGASGGGKEKPD